MTLFEAIRRGKKFRRTSRVDGWFVNYRDDIISDVGSRARIGKRDILANDWEYTDPIDTTTKKERVNEPTI